VGAGRAGTGDGGLGSLTPRCKRGEEDKGLAEEGGGRSLVCDAWPGERDLGCQLGPSTCDGQVPVPVPSTMPERPLDRGRAG
jgi:hypothetical protein